MEKKGFYRWAWLVIVLLGGFLMIYGGIQDVTIFFSDNLALIPSWYPVSPIVALVCGLIVLISAVLNITWGWQIKYAEGAKEHKLAQRVVLISSIAIVCDWISGYYGFGSLIALLTAIYLLRRS